MSTEKTEERSVMKRLKRAHPKTYEKLSKIIIEHENKILKAEENS